MSKTMIVTHSGNRAGMSEVVRGACRAAKSETPHAPAPFIWSVQSATPTLTNPAAFKRLQDRTEFFERVMRAQPPAPLPWLHRLFFTGRRSPAVPSRRDEVQP